MRKPRAGTHLVFELWPQSDFTINHFSTLPRGAAFTPWY
jgi:hypothetical protein